MEALGRMAAGVAHDFRNVLTVVLGHAGIIENDAAVSPTLRAEAERIRGAAERGIALTRELSAFGKEEDLGPPSVVHVPAIVTGFADVLRGAVGRRHGIEIEAPPGDGQVLIAPSQLERVLLNLGINARDALPDGGTIRIRVHQRDVPAGEHPGRYVVIDVADDGVGMDETTRLRCFEPFFTTKPEGQGTGLGMAIAYRIVDQAGGFIHVDSLPGRGTTMSVYLPRVAG